MILLLTILFAFLTISTAYADDSYYNNPSRYQTRAIPSQQYSSDNKNAIYNGQVTQTPSNNYLNNPDFEINTSLEAGYRTSELSWNIAGNIEGTSPNILSELKWEKINGYVFQPSIEYTQKAGPLKGLNVQASVNKSYTLSGENQDSDYSGDDRTFEFSRSNNNSDSGNSEGFSASIGYAFDFSDSRKRDVMRFTALVGYAIQNQTFTMTDGFQTIPADGAFADLNSSYDMELSMPFIGAEFAARFSNNHNIKIRGTVSKGTYDGTGHWNLRSDFAQPDSFKQEADGIGFNVGVKYGYLIYEDLQLTLASNFNYFKAEDGLDTVFFANGTSASTKFNEAEFQSIDYMAGLNYKF